MISLWNPDRFLGLVDRAAGRRVFSAWGVLLLVALVVAAVRPLVDLTWPDVESFGWVDLTLAYPMVILTYLLPHELAHGLACKHYGGKVDDMGVGFLYGVWPGAYCDISDSHTFPSRRHKVIVSLAGSYMSISMSSILLQIHHYSSDVFFLRKTILIVLLLTLIPMFYTLVPLVKLDGYYALADALGITNLRERSFRYIGQILQHRVLGIPSADPEVPPRERRIFLLYGISSGIFSTLLIFGLWFSFLIPLAIRYLRALGLIIAAAYALKVLDQAVVRPGAAFVRFVRGNRARIFTRGRSLVFASIGIGVAAILAQPWPLWIGGGIVIRPSERAVIRARLPGVIRAVLVREGDRVAKGQILATLRDDDLVKERLELRQDLAKAELSLRILKKGTRPERVAVAELAVEKARIASEFAFGEVRRHAALFEAKLRSASEAEVVEREAARHSGEQAGASLSLGLLRAGAREEEIDEAEARVRSLEARLAEVEGRTLHLDILSPIDGVVVGPNVEERLHQYLAKGDTLCEVHELSRVRVEIHLPRSEPSRALALGQTVELRAYGDPDRAVRATVERIRPRTGGEEGAIVVETSVLENPGWPSGLTGRGRVYGPERSIAYQLVGVPLLQLVDYEAWPLWG